MSDNDKRRLIELFSVLCICAAIVGMVRSCNQSITDCPHCGGIVERWLPGAGCDMNCDHCEEGGPRDE